MLLPAQAALLGLSAAASPGPFQALLLQRAALAGPRRALPLALVPLVSDPPVIVACLFALAGLPGGFVTGLQLLGGALLCWLGASGLRELAGTAAEADAATTPTPTSSSPASTLAAHPEPFDSASLSRGYAQDRLRGGEADAKSRGTPTAPRGFWRAALVNLLNPNAWLFWSLVGGPLLAGALRQSPGQAVAFLVAFYVPLTLTNAALVLAFGAVGRLGPRAARALGGFSAAAFLALGLAQLWRAAAG